MSPAPLRLPQHSVLPDYGHGGLFGLVSSFGRFLDGQAWQFAGLRTGASAQAAPVLVFWLVDGLGDGFLQRFGAGSALLADRVQRLSSVFPSTTASAVTTTLTGLAPRSHGLNGWFVNDPQSGGVLAALPLHSRAGHRLPADADLLRRLFPYPSLFQQRKRRAVAVLPASIADSQFSRHHCRGARVLPYLDVDHLVDSVSAAARALHRQGGGFIHAYYPDFDAISHHHGSLSREAQAAFQQVDATYRRLSHALAGNHTTLVVSADHGFIDSPPARFVRLDAWPEVMDMLAGPLWGERRAAFLRLRPGMQPAFAAWAERELAGVACLVESPALLAAGLFGHGPDHPQLAQRLGSHVLLMEPGWTLWDPRQGESVPDMLGVHGGLSADEMWVPLIVRPPAA